MSLLVLLKIRPSPPALPPGRSLCVLRPPQPLPPPPPRPLLRRLGFTQCSVIPGISFFGLGHSQWYLFLLLFEALSSVSSFVPFSSGKCSAIDIWKWPGSLESGKWPAARISVREPCAEARAELTGPALLGRRHSSWDFHSRLARLEC